MIKLLFSGYGGEYAIGKLTETELNNIKILLGRFNSELIIGKFELSFSDDRIHFHEFDDVYVGWGPTDLRVIEDESGEIEFEPEEIGEIELNEIEIHKSGFYLMTCSLEKGSFCNVLIDGEPKSFDISKFNIIKDDFSETWLNDSLISGARYCGVELELDYDYACTDGKSFNQTIEYYDSETDYWDNGIDILLDEIQPPKYNIINHIHVEGEEKLLWEYVEIFNKTKPLEEMELTDGCMVYYSPMIEDVYGKDICEKMWLSNSSHIKHARDFEMLDEVQKWIKDLIVTKKPEWLV